LRRTLIVLAVALCSLAAAAFAALRNRLQPPEEPGKKPPAVVSRSGVLSVSAQLDRAYVSETGGGEAYLEVDVMADGKPEEGVRVPVNAVLVLDRSGSMTGPKLARAKDAARELLARLNGDDRFALVDFGSTARLLVPSMAANGANKERALALVNALEAEGGTNMSAALDLAAPELAKGRAAGRADKVFLASDGQANEGISSRHGLLEVARRDFGGATTVSTFGVGEDYDEDLMTSLAAQAGGLTHFIRSADEIVPAFRAELQRATKAVARNVRLVVQPAAGTRVVSVIGYESDGGWVRLPDFAAGERRRVMVKLNLGGGKGVAELAKVQLSFLGEDGGAQACTASATTTFTADEKLAARRDSPAAFNGARAELNALAGEAASLFSMGKRGEAVQRVAKMKHLNAFVSQMPAAAAKPAERAIVEQELKGYEAMFDQTTAAAEGAPSSAPVKAARQQAFDNSRATY
jgi:Ca-activated chloride channel family protein